MIVIDIQQLKDRQNKFDTDAEEFLTKTRTSHPEVDDVIPIVLDAINIITPRKSGGAKTCHKDCVNALRMKSIKHIPKDKLTQICIKCEVKYDDLGFVIGVIHHNMPIEDRIVDNVTIKGLKTLIAQSKVEIDDITGEVKILQ